jgi:hypothetical protein
MEWARVIDLRHSLFEKLILRKLMIDLNGCLF